MKQNTWISFFLIMGISYLLSNRMYAQDNKKWAVIMNATVQENPPSITLHWEEDPDAIQYAVYRRNHPSESWGNPLVVLDGEATSHTDLNVVTGVVYEYSIYKVPQWHIDTILLTPGTGATFTIYDSWGDGICCFLGFGYYRVTAGDSVLASGGQFGFEESTHFLVPDIGMPQTPVVVYIYLDEIPSETTWELIPDGSLSILASGGPYQIPRFGFIQAGIKCPENEQRGTTLMVIEAGLRGWLQDELALYQNDLVGDGWMVSQIEVHSTDPIVSVKEKIRNACLQDSSINSLVLIGHIPVPYSGNVAMDGHPDHQGAWPSDVFYGDLDGQWTDEYVYSTVASRPENHNIPGDGKFDQSYIPSDIDLKVGRIDLSFLPSFAKSEEELMRRYFEKNHAFRHKQLIAAAKGLIDEHLNLSRHAIGWRVFPVMFGLEGVTPGDYMTNLTSDSYLWSYASAGSGYNQCGSVVSTQQYATHTFNTIFTMLYGSYFGDWDNPDNLLRAALASEGGILVNFWACNPSWVLHPMALGETIGYCTRLTQNMATEYTPFFGNRIIHSALMGDPTLRMHIVAPVSQVQTSVFNDSLVQLSWHPSPDFPAGYHVYRSASMNEKFERINQFLVTDTVFVDQAPLPGTNIYMVRAKSLTVSASGSYYNLSQGVFDSIRLHPQTVINCEDPVPVQIYPNPVSQTLLIDCSGISESLESITLFSITGCEMKRIPIANTTNQVYAISVQDLASGIYSLFIKIQTTTIVKKIVISHDH